MFIFWFKTDNKGDPFRGWNDEMGGVFCGEKAENRPNQLINDVRESTLSAGVFEFYFVLLPASWDLTALWARCTGVDSDLTMNAGWVFEISDKILKRKVYIIVNIETKNISKNEALMTLWKKFPAPMKNKYTDERSYKNKTMQL